MVLGAEPLHVGPLRHRFFYFIGADRDWLLTSPSPPSFKKPLWKMYGYATEFVWKKEENMTVKRKIDMIYMKTIGKHEKIFSTMNL